MRIYRLFYIIILLNTTSCSFTKSTIKDLRLSSNYCIPSISYTYDSTFLPLPTQAVYQSSLRNNYTEHTLLTANAAGILNDWEELDSLEKQMKTNPQLTQVYLDKRQEITTKLFLIMIEINSIAAELDCEGERAQELADYLTAKETKKVRILTMLSITTGAVTSAVTATAHGSEPNTGKEIIGIAGSTVSALLGILTLFSDKKVLFQHERNLLTDLWQESKTSSYYPPSLWYMLNEKLFSNSKQLTIAHHINERWKKLGDFNMEKEKTYQKKVDLLFGKGGYYDKDDLRTRANMLDQVEAAVTLFHQDIQSLVLQLPR